MAAAAFDRERAATFLEKADVALPDARLAGLREASDEALGLDGRLLGDCAAAFGISSRDLTRAPVQGTFHRLYHVKPGSAQLLRVAAVPGERWGSLMDLEARLAMVLRRSGMAVPACEYRGISSGGDARGAQLVERAAGTSVAELESDEARMTAALASMGRFLRELHRIRGEGAGPLSLDALGDAPPRLGGIHRSWSGFLRVRLDEHVGDCERAGDLSATEATQVRNRFGGTGFDLDAASLLHGDPGGHNFIVDEQGAIRAVLDWEDALVGDPLFDLASLCTFQPERRHPAIHAGYGVELTPASEAWERFWAYFLRIALAKTVHRRRFGYTDRPGREPAARRIQLALRRLQGAVS